MLICKSNIKSFLIIIIDNCCSNCFLRNLNVCVLCGYLLIQGAQWLSDSVLGLRLRGRGFEPHQRYCVVSISKNKNPSLVLVQPRKICPFITERLLMGCKESNQTNKQTNKIFSFSLSGPQIKLRNRKLVFLFLNQNICCGYSKEQSR